MTWGGKFANRLKGIEPPFWGLIAFCLFSPLSIAAANVAWVSALVLWLYHVFKRDGQKVSSPQRTVLDKGFALFVLASLMSLCVSLAPMASLFEFRSLGLIVVFYLFAWNAGSPEQKKILVVCFLGSSTLAAAYGAVEYLSGGDLFGHYDPTSNKIGGFFSMHLTFAEYLVLALCVMTGILAWARLKRRFLAVGLVACLLMGLGIFLSGAKGCFLGMAVGWFVIFSLKGRRRVVGFLAALAVLFLVLSVWRSGFLLDYVLSQYAVDARQATGPADSNTQRLYMWWAGFRISPGFFLNGVGLHAVEVIYPAFRHALARDATQWHLHNNLLQMGVTRGLFGLTALLFIFFLALRNGYGRFVGCSDPWEKGLTAGVLGALPAFLVCGLTEYSWGDSEVLMALYMLMGLGVSAAPSPKPLASSPQGSSPGIRFKGKEGSVGFSGRFCMPPGDSSERTGEQRSIVKTVLFSLLVGFLLLLAVLLEPVEVNVGSRILQAIVGLVTLVLLIRRFVVGAPGKEAGPVRCDLASGTGSTRRGEGSRFASSIKSFGFPEFRLMVPCVVVFAAYGFTRGTWMEGEELLAGTHGGGFFVSWVLLVNLFVVFLCARRAKDRIGDPLFDAALFAAVLLWMTLALGTNVLLRFATGTGGLFDPPFLVLLYLCTMTILLYGLARLVYVGGKVQDLFMSALCLALVLNPFF